MAWLQQLPSGKFHISFRFGGRKYKRSLGTSDPPQAKSRKVRLEDTIPTSFDAVNFVGGD